MEVREAVWAKRCQRDTADSSALVSELVSLREQAIAEDVHHLEPVTVAKLDQILRRIPDNTGLGSDCVQPGAIKHTPIVAKQERRLILDNIMRAGVLPWGLLYGAWGENGLSACFPYLCEFWIACSTANFLPGTSLMMATAHIMGISAGILFIDIQEIYDSVHLVLSRERAKCLKPTDPTFVAGSSVFGTWHTES